MKLRNKKTGGIIYDAYIRETHDFQSDNQPHVLAVFQSQPGRFPERVSGGYTSLADLNEEWEDYEEPKDFWFIDDEGDVECEGTQFEENLNLMKSIGNYFETKEEAKLAVEKLKAWKRLKDNVFKFETYGYDRVAVKNGRVNIMIKATFYEKYGEGSVKLSDLDLLFGGEE